MNNYTGIESDYPNARYAIDIDPYADGAADVIVDLLDRLDIEFTAAEAESMVDSLRERTRRLSPLSFSVALRTAAGPLVHFLYDSDPYGEMAWTITSVTPPMDMAD